MIFPRLNALSLWLLIGSMVLLFSAFIMDGGVNCGWTFYVPLSTMNLSSIDLMLFALHMSGYRIGICMNKPYVYGYITKPVVAM